MVGLLLFLDQTPQRNPRVRFGEPVHLFNNYYVRNTDVGVACQANAGCVVEGNHFENVEEPVTNHYAGPAGRVARDNLFAGESGQPDCSGTVEEPRTYYSYVLDDPTTVKAAVAAGRGWARSVRDIGFRADGGGRLTDDHLLRNRRRPSRQQCNHGYTAVGGRRWS